MWLNDASDLSLDREECRGLMLGALRKSLVLNRNFFTGVGMKPASWAWEGEEMVRTRWWTYWFLLYHGSIQHYEIMLFAGLVGNVWRWWVYDWKHSDFFVHFAFFPHLVQPFSSPSWRPWCSRAYGASATDAISLAVFIVFVFYFSFHLFRNLHPGLDRQISSYFRVNRPAKSHPISAR